MHQVPRTTPSRGTRPGRQGGAILVLLALAMVGLLAMAGLALDGSHLLLNKSRLQNGVDSAALAAAKVLDQSGDTTQATTAANAVLGQNAATAGNQELASSLAGDLGVT